MAGPYTAYAVCPMMSFLVAPTEQRFTPCMRALTLLIPGLIPLIPDAQIAPLPRLALALARGKSHWSHPPHLLEQVTPDPAAADGGSLARCAAHQSGVVDRAAHWCRADPVHFQVEGDALLLLESCVLQLHADETQSLIQTLNQHFRPDGLHFQASTHNSWLLGSPKPLPEQSTPPLLRVGRNIDGYLPEGSDAPEWRARFNEIQMLLHEHPVNLKRQQRGARTISGLWFWDLAHAGSASLPGFQHPADAPVQIHETLRCASAYGDAQEWNRAARLLDDEVLAPALAALQRAELSRLSVLGVEGRCNLSVHLTRGDLWKFWRRPRPLAAWPGVPPLTHR